MSEQEQGVGATLRTAREAQGLSIEDVARQLRLMNRQVVAMEDGNFLSLGQPVFARGFVRNYARMLGLDTQALLQSMGGGQVEPVEITSSAPLVMPRAWFTSGWLIAGMLALLAFTVVPIGLYAWLSSDAEEVTKLTPKPLPTQTRIPPVPPTAVTDPAPPLSAQEVQKTAELAPTNAETASVTASGTSSVANREMRFEFDDDAWVEVTDGTGQVLHRHMNYKGNSLSLSGQPPLTLVIGNAGRVHMTYNARPLDLKPYINANVARFSLEE